MEENNNNDPILTNFDSANSNNQSSFPHISMNNSNVNHSNMIISEQSGAFANNQSESVENIIKKYTFKLIPRKDIFINQAIYINTTSFKLYVGKCNEIGGQCSVIPLNSVSSNKDAFSLWLSNWQEVSNIINASFLIVKGISYSSDTDQVWLLFDYVYTNYKTKMENTQKPNENFKFLGIFYLLECINECSLRNIPLYGIDKTLWWYNKDDQFRYWIPFPQFAAFNMNILLSYSNEEYLDKVELPFNRYKSPEEFWSPSQPYSIVSDVWKSGCWIIEMFSSFQVWDNKTEKEIDNDLSKYFVPKIHDDIPRHMWGIICECLCPYKDNRINPWHLWERYSKHIRKLGLDCKDCEKYIVDQGEGNLLSNSMMNTSWNYIQNSDFDNVNPGSTRKCCVHLKNDAIFFCTHCNEILCEQCKTSTHWDHADKECFFEYWEYINTAGYKTSMFKEKFNKYILDADVPHKDVYDNWLQICKEDIELLYNDQKSLIEKQFSYWFEVLNQIKKQEIDHWLKYKTYFSKWFNDIFENYNVMQDTINEVRQMVDAREKLFKQFTALNQRSKEDVMKGIIKEDNLWWFKKKNIIKHVTQFHKDKTKITLIKKYFETFISHYKDNKINEIVKLLEKKNEAISKKYLRENLDEIYQNLINEYELVSLISSRNYFSQNGKELYIPWDNTNKIFSYSFEIDKFLLTKADFTGLPIASFPIYSRSITMNGSLFVCGGYDDSTKSTLPYFCIYNRVQNKLNRLKDMIYGHSAHSWIVIPNNTIIAVSGGGIVKCEKYNSDSNKWTELPEINIPRQNATLFYHNKQYLYAFGGAFWNEQKKMFEYVERIERLNLGFGSVKGDNKWYFIDYKCRTKDVNWKKSVMAAISYKNNQWLLIGGAVNYNKYSDDVIVFDFDKLEFSHNGRLRLPTQTCFPNKSFMYTGEKCYQLDNDGNVVEFDFMKDQFSVVKENRIVKEEENNYSSHHNIYTGD